MATQIITSMRERREVLMHFVVIRLLWSVQTLRDSAPVRKDKYANTG
jgi:hypothetical protein